MKMPLFLFGLVALIQIVSPVSLGLSSGLDGFFAVEAETELLEVIA